MALLVSVLMLVMVLPEFAKVYQSFDAPLPWFTQGLLGVSALLIAVGPYLALLLGALLLGYCRWLHPHPPWRRREQAALLRLPLIARLVSGGALSQTFRILTMTQRAGLTLVEGLNAAALAADHLLYRQALEQVQRQIAEGEAFHHALACNRCFRRCAGNWCGWAKNPVRWTPCWINWRSGTNGRRTSWPIRWRKRWSHC